MIFRNILKKIKIKPKRYYFIATVRRYKAKTENGREYETEDSRTWGFYRSKKKAIKAVIRSRKGDADGDQG